MWRGSNASFYEVITYLSLAKQCIAEISHNNDSQFYNEDFLAVCPNYQDLFSTNLKREFADLIIANPPYVRTQVLGAEKAQQLAKDFNLTGRVDLYYPFFMAMTNALKIGGILGVITSNRYICTKSGSDIRKFLLENYHVLEVIDLGDTKLFDAAVLPAIFIGIKKKPSEKSEITPKYTSIYETAPTDNAKLAKSIFEVLNDDKAGVFNVNGSFFELKKGILRHGTDKSGIWQLEDNKDNCYAYKKKQIPPLE